MAGFNGYNYGQPFKWPEMTLIRTTCIVPGCAEVIVQATELKPEMPVKYSLCMCNDHTWTHGKPSRVHVANPHTFDN